MKTKCAIRPRVGVRVRDLNQSLDFFVGFLGLKVVNRHRVEATKGEVVNLGNDDNNFILELSFYEKGSRFNTEYVTGEALDHLSFMVSDLDRALEEARSAGYPTVLEVKEGDGRWAYIADPNGIWIELHA